VVAGIVGRRKFAYDIWGDTVNTASRMETTGEPGEVNISGATYELVKREPGLSFLPRGRVMAKGKGELEMYYVRHASTEARAAMDEHVERSVSQVIAEGPTRDANTQRVTPQHVTELGPLRILLVEDNAFNVMVAEDELAHLIPGCTVDVAANGAIAVELATRNTYDVILMDVQMPVMDGYQATRTIRALPDAKARVPIIALTANVMKAEVDRCMEAGMDAFVPKPFKREELMGAIVRVVAGKASA
jgi:CheY-like chemotaxis protein